MADPIAWNNRCGAKLVVIGAGLIGLRHAEIIKGQCHLAGIVEPDKNIRRSAAETFRCPVYPTTGVLLSEQRPDGIVIATPNQTHETIALECIEAGIPVLVEKPIADSVEAAKNIVAEARKADVPILVGHHRRYNPILVRAKGIIEEGDLGRLISVHTTCWFHKPDGYFTAKWRQQKGAGPVMINLIHDIDTLRYLCGEVVEVQAMQSNAVRAHSVEDTAVVILRFSSGMLATLSVSDAISAPWSWEMTSEENPEFPHTGQSNILIGGTLGSLSVPDMTIWKHQHSPDWKTPICGASEKPQPDDPLVLQIRHFADVALSRVMPLVSGEEGLATLKVTAAIKGSAETGKAIALPL